MENTPTITLSRRYARYVIVHSCLFCDHKTVQIGHQCNDKMCHSGADECSEYVDIGCATMTARRHGRIISSSHLDQDYLLQWMPSERKDNDLITKAFPELVLVDNTLEIPITVKFQQMKSRWYCFSCPCNNGETKTYRSSAGLYNHRKTCKGRVV